MKTLNKVMDFLLKLALVLFLMGLVLFLTILIASLIAMGLILLVPLLSQTYDAMVVSHLLGTAPTWYGFG